MSCVRTISDGVAFAVLAHSSPQALQDLLEELAPYPVFLHIDKHFSQTAHSFAPLTQWGHVRLAQNSFCVHWGGFSVVRAMVAVMREAMGRAGEWESLAFLSGSCFPLRPMSEFAAAADPSMVWVNGAPLAVSDAEQPFAAGSDRMWRVDRRHFLDGPVGHLRKVERIPVGRAARPLLRELSRLKPVALPRGSTFYFGSQWVRLPKALVAELVTQYDHGRFDHLKHAYAPDEIFIPTYVYNSNWARKVRPPGLKGAGTSIHETANFHWLLPEVKGYVDEEDIEKAKLAGAFFVRKVSNGERRQFRLRHPIRIGT